MRTMFVGLGVIGILVGVVWTLQGSDVIMGSVMSGSVFWLGMGVLLLIIGAASFVFGAKSPRPTKTA